MKRWQGSCIGAFLVLLIGGSSLIFFVPFGGAMIAAYSTGSPPMYFVPMPQITLTGTLEVRRLTRPIPAVEQVISRN